MLKLSPSSLNLFRECPRCFWLHMKGIYRPSGAFPSLPSGFDRILKQHFDQHRRERTYPHELEGTGAQLFQNMELLNKWRNNFRGIQYQEGDVLLHGAVDDMLEKGGKLIVLDFKTRGFPTKEDSHEYYQDQLNIYTMLLQKNNHATEDYAYLLFYYPDRFDEECQVLMNFELKKVKVDASQGEQLFREAVECLKGGVPAPGRECVWCKWAENLINNPKSYQK